MKNKFNIKNKKWFFVVVSLFFLILNININGNPVKNSISHEELMDNVIFDTKPQNVGTFQNVSSWNYTSSSHISAQNFGNLGLFNASWDSGSNFNENASIDENFTFAEVFNVVYTLSFSFQIISFQSINNASLIANIDNNTIWSQNFTDVLNPTQELIDIPSSILNNLTQMNLKFTLNLDINTLELGSFVLLLNNPICITPKWNITRELSLPSQIIEGNEYILTYIFKHQDIGNPVVGQLISFEISFSTSLNPSTVLLFTNIDGSIQLRLSIPTGESFVQIKAKFDGQSNISKATFIDTIQIQQKISTYLSLYTIDETNSLIGGSSIRVKAKLMYGNNTGISNALITFQIGLNIVQGLTDNSGNVAVTIILPTSDGSFMITLNYKGSSQLMTATAQSTSLTIISSTTYAINQAFLIVLYIAIIVCMTLISNFIVKRWLVKPWQLAIKQKYLHKKDQFEDGRNILQLMVIDKEAGTQMYSKNFFNLPIDSTLLSGFLHAIVTFGQEVLPKNSIPSMQNLNYNQLDGQIQEFNFLHFKIIMCVTSHLRTALITFKEPSQRIIKEFLKFADQTEKKFCVNFEDTRCYSIEDENIGDLIEKSFQPTINSYHILDITKNYENSKELKKTFSNWEIMAIKTILKEPFNGSAYLEKLHDKIIITHSKNPLEFLEAIFQLKKKEILIPLNTKLIEFQQKLPGFIKLLPSNCLYTFSTISYRNSNIVELLSKENKDTKENDTLISKLKELGLISNNMELTIQGKILCHYLKFHESEWISNSK